MNNIAFDDQRLIRATPALNPAIRRAAWPNGVTEEQLRGFERDVGIASPTPPATDPSKPPVAAAAKPAPSASAPASAKLHSPAPVKAVTANPFFAAVERATSEFNAHHKEDQ